MWHSTNKKCQWAAVASLLILCVAVSAVWNGTLRSAAERYARGAIVACARVAAAAGDSTDMRLARRVHAAQAQHRGEEAVGTGAANVMFANVPLAHCAFPVRIGNALDGGKWMCNPWRATVPCTVYSLGIDGDTSWERHLLELVPNCTVVAVDESDTARNSLPVGDRRYSFVQWRIGTGNNTFGHLLSQFHTHTIDFLKIDIEGAEYGLVPTILAGEHLNKNRTTICHILIEMHHDYLGQGKNGFGDLIKMITNAGFFMYYNEYNYYSANGCCSEYSFIHRECFEQYNMRLGDVMPSYF